jgi:hypothetical protein
MRNKSSERAFASTTENVPTNADEVAKDIGSTTSEYGKA